MVVFCVPFAFFSIEAYYWSKREHPIWNQQNPFPISISNQVLETLANLRPKLTVYSSLESVRAATTAIETEILATLSEKAPEYQKFIPNTKVQPTNGNEKGLGVIQEENDEQPEKRLDDFKLPTRVMDFAEDDGDEPEDEEGDIDVNDDNDDDGIAKRKIVGLDEEGEDEEDEADEAEEAEEEDRSDFEEDENDEASDDENSGDDENVAENNGLDFDEELGGESIRSKSVSLGIDGQNDDDRSDSSHTSDESEDDFAESDMVSNSIIVLLQIQIGNFVVN